MKDNNKSKHYCAVFLCLLLMAMLLMCEKMVGTKESDSEISNENAGGEKCVYLTFDDGPSDNTRKVLKILDTYDVKATFFMIGSQITGEYTNVVKEVDKAGHSIGIHTYCHKYNQIYSSADSYIKDFDKTCKVVENTVGYSPKIYRFPGGSCNVYISCVKEDITDILSKRGYTYYDWNVSGEDSVGKPCCDSIYNNVIKDVCDFDKPIILLHDSSINDNTVKVLPKIIEYIKESGYTFKPLKA